MQLYSTKNPSNSFTLREAVIKGLPEDNGLFMPREIPVLSQEFLRHLQDFSFQEISFQIARALIKEAIPEQDLRQLVQKAINFPAPVVSLSDKIHILELFHGPSLAFKDFGARFMAQLMAYFKKESKQDLIILVATSGDTGGAVAAGFFKTPGIKVVILYPSGKVSDLQEKQLTTLGENILALEVNGNFDDCQALVKTAFLDQELNNKLQLSSANSINIARLIPQSFYYFEAYKQLDPKNGPVVFSVPSGNFGNLSAGLMAKKMGLPVHKFIASTNINDIVPHYIRTGNFNPRPSVRTLSNAMDVGNPSNFDRMMDLYGSTWNNFKEDVSGFYANDRETVEGIKEVYKKYHYKLDPHGSVGYLGLVKYQEQNPNTQGVVLETAHPSKFIHEIQEKIDFEIEIPDRLESLRTKVKKSTILDNQYADFKSWLLKTFS